jgi:hypothetical protein
MLLSPKHIVHGKNHVSKLFITAAHVLVGMVFRVGVKAWQQEQQLERQQQQKNSACSAQCCQVGSPHTLTFEKGYWKALFS